MGASTKVIQAAAGAGGALPTGKYLAVTPDTGTDGVTLLDHTTPGSLSLAATYTLPDRNARDGSLDWSPDGSYIGVRVFSNTVSLSLLDHTTEGSLSFSDDIDVGNTENGVAFDPRGDYVMVGQGDTTKGYYQIVDYSNPASLSIAGELYWNLQTPPGGRPNFSPDGDYFLYGANSFGGLHISDASTPGSLSHLSTYTIAGNTSVQDCRFSPSGDYVLVMNNLSAASYGAVQLFSFSSGTLTFEQMINPLGTNNGYRAAWSPEDEYVVVGLNNSTNDVILYEHTSGSLSVAATYSTSASRAWAVDFTPDGQYIAVGTNASPFVTLLDHTTPGSLSLASTYTTASQCFNVRFSPT